jgi:hypothetical protein
MVVARTMYVSVSGLKAYIEDPLPGGKITIP